LDRYLPKTLREEQLLCEGKMSRLFVGNIPFACTDSDLQNWFEDQGYEVTRVEIIHDKLTGEPRGFAFVELRLGWKAKEAIKNLNQKKFGGKKLTVNAAMPIGSNRKSEEELSRIN
jgi:RNA recognition motif-containing protein